MSVCLYVSNITQKVAEQFRGNFQEISEMGQEKNKFDFVGYLDHYVDPGFFKNVLYYLELVTILAK